MRLPQLQFHRSFSALAIRLLLIGFALPIAFPMQAGARNPQSTATLTASPSILRFEAVPVGQSQTVLATVTNSGSTSVTITGASSSNAQFITSSLSWPVVLAAGQSVNVSVTFTPTTEGWTGTNNITFSCAAPSPVFDLEVMGTGVHSVALAANPSTLSFPTVLVGQTDTLPVVITNSNSSNVVVTNILSRTSQFAISGPALPVTLAQGQSVTVNVSFTPQSAGTWGGIVAVFPGIVIPLTGTASIVGQLALAPTPLNFGDVTIGKTATQEITLTATGGSVTISSSASGSSQFVLDGASFPFTIAAGASQSFNVVFTPSASGQQSGSLSFVSNASDSNAVESLSGIGTQPSYSVGLNWDSSADVVGYNIYRSSSPSGSFAKINSSLNPSTAYTDGTVASGQTYYYAATSVNSAGVESSRSTPAEAVVP